MIRRTSVLALALVVAGALPTMAQPDLQARARQYFQPVTAVAIRPADAAKVELGRQLFFDPRLSQSGAISCNTCHNLASFGVDNLSTSLGHRAQTGSRNAPTVLNASLHFVQFWDGRAKDLTAQAKGPILNPVEMAMPSEAVTVSRLKSIDGYVGAFRRAFPGEAEPVTYERMAQAIAAFEATLVTPSRFDRYLRGEQQALAAHEQRGLALFLDRGCVSCHDGAALGGNKFMKFGLVKAYPGAPDAGRFALTKLEADRGVFKVPSLRNIAHTYPYFHDGQVWTLDEAVRTMGETQLGWKPSDAETGALVAFLQSLTGELPEQARRMPILPPSGPGTTRPAR